MTSKGSRTIYSYSAIDQRDEMWESGAKSCTSMDIDIDNDNHTHNPSQYQNKNQNLHLHLYHQGHGQVKGQGQDTRRQDIILQRRQTCKALTFLLTMFMLSIVVVIAFRSGKKEGQQQQYSSSLNSQSNPNSNTKRPTNLMSIDKEENRALINTH